MTFGSLFAGIGGLDLGLERAGMRCVWQVEIDDYCRRVLAKHWPDVRRWDDVKTFPPEGDWQCDLICGGFPCQDISNAGKRAGMAGERSGLWAEFVRIIRVVRPRFVLVENVAALLCPIRKDGWTIGPAPMGAVLGDLAALGFDAEWHCLPAACVGAPHIRDRAFIFAYPAGLFRTPIFGSEQNGNLSGNAYGRLLAHAHGSQGSERQGVSEHARAKLTAAQRSLRSCRAWDVGPFDDDSVDDGLSTPVDALDALGNAVVPQVAEWIGRRILEAEGQLKWT